MTADDGRRLVAGLLRQLGHDILGADLTEAALAEVAELLVRAASLVRDAPARRRNLPEGRLEDFLAAQDPGESTRLEIHPDALVSGAANPHGLNARTWRDGDVAVAEVEVGRAFEGAPGRVHGGISALLIDETMGHVLALHGLLAFTVNLEVRYVGASPTNETLVARAWLVHHEGRKITIACEVRHHDTVVATASALFISVSTETFLQLLASP